MSEAVVVGRVGRPHGVRGDVTVELHTDMPDRRFAPGARLGVDVPSDASIVGTANANTPELPARRRPNGGSGNTFRSARDRRARGAPGSPAPPGGGGQRAAPRSGPPGHTPARPAAPPPPTELVVAVSRWHSGRFLVRFSGVVDRDGAEALRGLYLTIDTDEAGEAGDAGDSGDAGGPGEGQDADTWWDRDLVGLRARTPQGVEIGTVVGVVHAPAGDLLAITAPDGGEHLVPFVREIVPTVDTTARTVVVDPPPGLLDLNRGAAGQS